MKRLKRIVGRITFILAAFLLVGFVFPTWTPHISGMNSISVLEHVALNGADHALMIRGNDTKNTIVIFVHGGPGCSEIPYVAKYQDLLEQRFTIVQYDQRGSGKSHDLFEDYSKLTAQTLVDDLLALTDYVAARFYKEKVLLVGHSFGTYLAMQAAAQAPEKYYAYIGIGQVADVNASERESLGYCLTQAKAAGDAKTVTELEALREGIESGQALMPRGYIRRYGGAARQIDDNMDYVTGFLFHSEYNLFDVARYYRGVEVSQKALLPEALKHPLPGFVKELAIPCYFVMGKYDYMTSATAAKAYFDVLAAPKKEFLLYENSAHYPQFEEKQLFAQWMEECFADLD